MDNLLLVFPHKVENIEEWNNIINKFDKENYYVYLLQDISKIDFDIGSLSSIIEYYKNIHKDINKIVVMANARDLIFSWYRCYNSIVDDFIYFIDKGENNFFTTEDEQFSFYYNLYEFNGIYKEKVEGKIYLNKKDDTILPVYYNPKYFDLFCNFIFFDKNEKKLLNKTYIFNGFEYSFSSNKEKSEEDIVNLDNLEEGSVYKDNGLQLANRYIKLIEYYSKHEDIFIKCYAIVAKKLNKIKKEFLKLNNCEKNRFELKMKSKLYGKSDNDKYKIFLGSALLDIFNDELYLEYLLNLSIDSKYINKFNRFFVYYQCTKYIFFNKNADIKKILSIRNKLYDKIFDEFLSQNCKCEMINKKHRDADLAFVISSQILSVNHAPTKSALDVCYNLIKKLNKKVILINTKEVLTVKGLVPMQNISSGNVISEYIDIDTIQYKDVNIPFYQPSVLMPDDEEIVNILNVVKSCKPGLIINIGTTLVGDLCGQIVPTVTIPQVNNEYSKSNFHVVNDKENYEKYIKDYGMSGKNLIISKFQFELKDKKNTFTRKQLRIPENKFIISVIGTRLNDEIDEGFLEVLDKICKFNNAYILFINKFDFNELHTIKYKNIVNNCKNMGYQEDLLAIVENIDLYLNPNRSGGGTSAIYSLYAGKPVVTLKHGDVAFNVGKEFCVDNYNEMISQIQKYYTDIEFYNKQACIAKKRAKELTNMSTYIENVYHEVLKSDLYY